MSGFEDITYEIEDRAAIITINRPPERYNAFRGKTVEELIKPSVTPGPTAASPP